MLSQYSVCLSCKHMDQIQSSEPKSEMACMGEHTGEAKTGGQSLRNDAQGCPLTLTRMCTHTYRNYPSPGMHTWTYTPTHDIKT